MSRTLSTGLQSVVDGSETRIITLLEVTIDGTMYRFAGTDADVISNGYTYTAFPFQYAAVDTDKSGRIGAVEITISNVTRVGTNWVASTDISGSPVTLKVIDLSMPDEQVTIFTGNADTATVTDGTFSVQCLDRKDWRGERLPRRTYSAYCPWVFKSTRCGYAGAETSCGKTWDDCEARSNTTHFGGFMPWKLT